MYKAVFKAKQSKASNDPDTLDWSQAMHSEHQSEFLKASQDEIKGLAEKGTWYDDEMCNATTKIVPSKWVFYIKRTSDGSIRKFKGWIVLRGDLQEDNGEDNYSPVAAWPTVRSFLQHFAQNNSGIFSEIRLAILLPFFEEKSKKESPETGLIQYEQLIQSNNSTTRQVFFAKKTSQTIFSASLPFFYSSF